MRDLRIKCFISGPCGGTPKPQACNWLSGITVYYAVLLHRLVEKSVKESHTDILLLIMWRDTGTGNIYASVLCSEGAGNCVRVAVAPPCRRPCWSSAHKPDLGYINTNTLWKLPLYSHTLWVCTAPFDGNLSVLDDSNERMGTGACSHAKIKFCLLIFKVVLNYIVKYEICSSSAKSFRVVYFCALHCSETKHW